MKRIRAVLAIPAFLCLLTGAACAQDIVSSVLWAGTAVEHNASLIQAYTLARSDLDRAIGDRNWTAAVEQEGKAFRSLPPAIVMDLDETILDNSPYEARQALPGAQSKDDAWKSWVNEARAAALPGALPFAAYAHSRGVTVFYVTNRDADLKDATRTNLRRDGFPLDSKVETLYCRGEKPDWTSDKGTRRMEIAKRYRILLLFGDDFGDFVSGAADTVAHRKELAAKYADRWGTKWIVLPNAMYGSWANSLTLPVTSPTVQQQREAAERYLRQIAEGQPAGPNAR